MTRETKIGLLVGLAFIIVIGILLSDHLTSSTEPPQAALANAGNNVRQAVANPGTAAPQLPAVQAPTNPTPSQQVPTRDELTPGPNPTTIVKVGPSNNATNNAQPSRVVDNNQPEASGPFAANDQPTISRAPATPDAMSDVAKRHGEELVLVDANGRAVHGTLAPRTNKAEYKAQAGDSLSKMASKLMGSNTRANRDAIVAANPSLKNDPNKVIVGRTYIIPTPVTTTTTTSNATEPQPAPTPTDPQQPTATTPTPTSTSENIYTVKAGDSLWKIATDQCGHAGAIAAIKELNKDVLVGDNKDQVTVGMKVRLPSKPVTTNS